MGKKRLSISFRLRLPLQFFLGLNLVDRPYPYLNPIYKQKLN